jgi:hypothetical protein
VTQFVGIHLLGVGGALLLPLWIGAVAYLGARRGTIPAPLAWLALLPLFRVLVVVAGWLGLPLGGLWPLYMAAIPAAWIWLILLGVGDVASHDRRVDTARL